MKKVFLIIVTSILLAGLVACGSGSQDKSASQDNRSFATFEKAYTDAGHTLEKKDTPLFQMIKAKDGIMFYIDNQVVKIYEFESEKALDKAVNEQSLLKGFARNGKFLCESGNENALCAVFKTVGK